MRNLALIKKVRTARQRVGTKRFACSRNALIFSWFTGFASVIYAQPVPQPDSLVLANGLKVYLLPDDDEPEVTVKLIVDGGKKDETACQVGYAGIVQQLLTQALSRKQGFEFTRKPQVSCVLSEGRTIIQSSVLSSDLEKGMLQIAAALIKLPVNEDQLRRAVALEDASYSADALSQQRLSGIYRDLVLYGTKSALGRSYCQYQLHKMTPAGLKAFYQQHYLPKRSLLLVCGKFNVTAAKKVILNKFSRWGPAHKERNVVGDDDVRPLKMRNRDLSFVNRYNSPQCLLTWLRPAPPARSPDRMAYRVTCELLALYLKRITAAVRSSLTFSSLSYTANSMEVSCAADHSGLGRAIHLMDSCFQDFGRSAFTNEDIKEAIGALRAEWEANNSKRALVALYDPLAYNFSWHAGYLQQLSGVTGQDIQLALKNYFDPGLYKLIIVGQEQLLAQQLKALEPLTIYQAADFETCDDACVERSKKKWKKGGYTCCFHCFLRGWCPCMYSPARLQ